MTASLFEYWFLFPVGITIAVCGMSSSISGSNFWTPVYLLWLGLEPKIAFCVSLATMLFGFGSGLHRNLRDGTFDRPLFGSYLLVAAPATLVGALLSTRIEAFWLLLVFASFVLCYGLYLIYEFAFDKEPRAEDLAHEKIHRFVALVAGLLHGTIASGVGVLLLPALLDHKRIRHHATAVGTSVALAFSCSLISVIFRIDKGLFATLHAGAYDIFRILLFAAPGVVIGGQLGPRLARRLPRRYLRLWIGLLLVVVGGLVGYRALA